MVFNNRSGRPIGSRWAAKCREPTARVEGAILFRSPERGYPVSGARARGLLSVAESALTTKVGSSTRGPPIAPCDPVPWYAWRPVEAGRSGGMHKGGGWASRGPTRPCPSNNKLGSESCLWRRKGLLLPCQRSSRSSEPPADDVEAVDVEAALRLRSMAEGRFAFAQRPPTCVGGVCRDNFPGVDQPHGHALLHPLWVLPGGQGCYTGLIHPDMQVSVTPCVVWNPWIQPALKGAHAEQAQL